MNTRTKIAACTLLLMVMGVAPMANAHMAPGAINNQRNIAEDLNSPSGLAPENVNTVGCRWYDAVNSTTCPSGDLGVSGNYITSGGNFFLATDLTPLTVLVAGNGVTLFPFGFIGATGSPLCDMEVGGSGQSAADDPTFGLNEKDVDGYDAGSDGAMLPDGTWDDGGFDAACHVGSYDEPRFDSFGCFGQSHAEDVASGGNVWIATACDSIHTVSNAGAGLGCLVNVLIQNHTGFQGCLNETVSDLLTPVTSPTTVVCGFDNGPDYFNFGRGGGDGGVGVAYPPAGSDDSSAACNATSLASTYVMPHLELNAARGFTADVLTNCYANDNVGNLTGCVMGPPQRTCSPGAVLDFSLCQGKVTLSQANESVSAETTGWIDWNDAVSLSTNFTTPSDGGNSVHVLPTDFFCGEAENGDLIDTVADMSPLYPLVFGENSRGCTTISAVASIASAVLGEARSQLPQCANTLDDEATPDGLVDADDPECHTNGDASDPTSYDPCWDDESAGSPQSTTDGCA